MDLHDFKDVAENYDNYLEAMYNQNDAFEGFKDFYFDLAKEYGKNGVIDIACGTGAVLLHLAEKGIDIDGTDLSEEMIKIATKKANEKNLSLNIFPANMTDFKSNKKYSLAIIARSGFMHLSTPQEQRAALLNIRENLMTLSAKSEMGTVTENLSVSLHGEDIKIGFDTFFIRECLRAINDEYVKIKFNGEINPCVITPNEGDNYLFLILPLKA